jgi:hypothetical protein
LPAEKGFFESQVAELTPPQIINASWLAEPVLDSGTPKAFGSSFSRALSPTLASP